jgi:hypothetical protein
MTRGGAGAKAGLGRPEAEEREANEKYTLVHMVNRGRVRQRARSSVMVCEDLEDLEDLEHMTSGTPARVFERQEG